MSSIMTNAGAMTALQTLKATNKSLETTQGRISTGFRVSEAAHNAAYWSIATTMRSDNNAMSTVKDALGLGAAQVDIAYTAMDVVKDTLDEIKKKLVAASQPDVDKSKIQSEIEQLQNDLRTYAKSATFSGGNWLDVAEFTVQKVVASFIRADNGAISLGTIDIDTSKVALFSADADQPGLLQGTGNYRLDGLEPGSAAAAVWSATDPTPPHTPATIGLGTLSATGITLYEGDTVSFDVAYGGTTKTITIEGTAAGVTIDRAGGAAVLEAALNDATDGFGASYFSVAVDSGTGAVTVSRTPAAIGEDGAAIAVSNMLASTEGAIDILGIDITDATPAELNSLINAVDRALSKVTTAASDLGAIKTRISSQQDFVGKIMDAVSRGVGQLVDADMEEESTRLQALQVQQQLGIQALSIANANAQNILSLFRS